MVPAPVLATVHESHTFDLSGDASDVKRRRSALILQGGGALGAYEYGAIKALYEQPGFAPDIVTGVSIGAITAAILVGARGDPVETLEDMWNRFSGPGNGLIPREIAASLSIFGTQGMYQVRPSYLAAPFLATSVYDVAPLYDSLERWVDFDRLNHAEPLCIVTATDIASGTLAEFSNRTTLTADHVVASASLPPAFPMTLIDGRAYWDGGLISNTPLRPAINALEQLDAGSTEVEWELIVIDLFEHEPKLPENMAEVTERAFQLGFLAKFQHDMKQFRAMSSYTDLVHELDHELAPDSPIRQHPGFRRLLRHRCIEQLTLIANPQPESLGGSADFSRARILRRIELGYEDARRVLHQRQSADPRKQDNT